MSPLRKTYHPRLDADRAPQEETPPQPLWTEFWSSREWLAVQTWARMEIEAISSAYSNLNPLDKADQATQLRAQGLETSLKRLLSTAFRIDVEEIAGDRTTEEATG